ncbi:MAG TPA: hypothetical protein PLH36_06750 [Armatimonadota bacterium]|nr:hypothetical protein [Armatimonadota bacterium]
MAEKGSDASSEEIATETVEFAIAAGPPDAKGDAPRRRVSGGCGAAS